MKTLSLNILDIVQNSIRAKAEKISVTINESEAADSYLITITDNGTGIPKEIMQNVTDPFITTRTKRRMGLGLALLKYHAELAGGSLEILSEPGAGTKVIALFSCSHIDRQPLGDIAGVLKILIASNQEIDFTYHHCTDEGEYRFNTSETKQFLEADTLNDMVLLEDIKGMINENLKEIGASGVQFEATF
jgi:hypothetical protein